MLKLIQTLIRCAGVLSPSLAAQLAVALASRPQKFKRPQREMDQLAHAKKLHYRGSRGTDNVAWSWGEGPVVIISHGWSSRGSQMASLAMEVAEAGFQAVAIDFTAHGDSAGKLVHFDDLAKDLVALSSQFDEVFALVGHSAGGVMSMAAREFGFKAQRYAVLGAPVAPYPALEAIRKLLKARDAVIEKCKQVFAGHIGVTWEELERGRAFYHGDGPLLLVYDTDDQEVSVEQGKKIQGFWKDSRLVITEGLGHRKLMWDPEVTQEVVTFLKA
jgi:pimeloyl-ACP methyl ester carboxylesterase